MEPHHIYVMAGGTTRSRRNVNKLHRDRMIQGRLVGPNGLAEWTQREIWPEIDTLFVCICCVSLELWSKEMSDTCPTTFTDKCPPGFERHWGQCDPEREYSVDIFW